MGVTRLLLAGFLVLAVAAPASARQAAIAWQPGLVVHFGDSIPVADAITWTAPDNGTVPVIELRVYPEGLARPTDASLICTDTAVLTAGYIQSFTPLDFGPTQLWTEGGGIAQVRLAAYDLQTGRYRVVATSEWLVVLP